MGILLKKGWIKFKGLDERLVFLPKHINIAEWNFDHRLGGIKDPSLQLVIVCVGIVTIELLEPECIVIAVDIFLRF